MSAIHSWIATGHALVAQAVEEVEEHRSRLLVVTADRGPPSLRGSAPPRVVVARERVDVLLGLEQRAEERDVRLELLLA